MPLDITMIAMISVIMIAMISSCSHDVVLSLYLAKLFLIDVYIFNIHPTPFPLTSSFVTI